MVCVGCSGRVAALVTRSGQLLFFFFTLVTGPRRSLSLKLSDTKVYEPQIRASLGNHTTTILGGNPRRLQEAATRPRSEKVLTKVVKSL